MIDILQELNARIASYDKRGRSFYVKHLRASEPIPQFGHGIPDHPLTDRTWIWVAYSLRGEPVAILSAAPVNGLVLFVRIYATSSAPSSVFVSILRKALADSLSRGYTRYGTYLDMDSPACVKLLRVIKKAGGVERGEKHVLVYGPTDIGRL